MSESDASPNPARPQPARKPVVNAVSRGQGTAGANQAPATTEASPKASPIDHVSASHPPSDQRSTELVPVPLSGGFSPSEIHFLTGAVSARIESLRAGVVSGGSLLNPNTTGVAARESLIATGIALLARLQGTGEEEIQPLSPTEPEGAD